jgi:NADH-quinone oxidoreductase subunit L
MFKMGGLKKKLPIVYWTFLAGAASLAALPLITAGFFSKDQILWLAWAGEKGNVGFFLVALSGAFLTAVYTTRMVVLTFYGEAKTELHHHPGRRMTIPLMILGTLSIVAGFVELPHTFGHITIFSDFLKPVLPETILKAGIASSEWIIQLVAALVTMSGVYLGYTIYYKQVDRHIALRNKIRSLHEFLLYGWGFDALYNALFVKPFIWISAINKDDVVDKFYEGLGWITNAFHDVFVKTQSGIVRWYIMGIVIGAVIILAIGLML